MTIAVVIIIVGIISAWLISSAVKPFPAAATIVLVFWVLSLGVRPLLDDRAFEGGHLFGTLCASIVLGAYTYSARRNRESIPPPSSSNNLLSDDRC